MKNPKKKLWKHKTKYKKKTYVGSYEFQRVKPNERICIIERVFILTHGKHRITFESWNAAKKLGWKKI